MSIRVTRVCFTINKYTEPGYVALKSWCEEHTKYAVIGKEVAPKTKMLHLQCFAILKKRMRLGSFTKELKTVTKATSVWTAAAKADNEEAADYCKKDGSFWEFGSYPKGKGARTDIKEFLEDAKTMDDLELAEAHPTEYVKYNKAAEKIKEAYRNKLALDEMKQKYSAAKLRNWQVVTLAKMAEQNERQITWVFDPEGNTGKSWLGNWLIVNHGAFLIEGGRKTDIAYAYNGEGIVVFDFTRQQEELVNYAMIESFKNGRVFSSKYESKLKVFKPAKVVCFSNFYPDKDKLSQDRWQILQFTGLNLSVNGILQQATIEAQASAARKEMKELGVKGLATISENEPDQDVNDEEEEEAKYDCNGKWNCPCDGCRRRRVF